MNITISNALIRHNSHVIGTDPCAVTWLNLSSLDIGSMKGLEECTSLIELDLSQNKLGSDQLNFNGLHKLRILDLSSNKLKCIPHNLCDCLKELRTLSFKQNMLSDVIDIKVLQGFSKLRSLSFQNKNKSSSNPFCSNPNYLVNVDKYVPGLEFLDGESMILRKASCIARSTRSVEADPKFQKSLPLELWHTGEIDKTAALLGAYGDDQDVIQMEKSFDAAREEFKTALKRGQEILCHNYNIMK